MQEANVCRSEHTQSLVALVNVASSRQVSADGAAEPQCTSAT